MVLNLSQTGQLDEIIMEESLVCMTADELYVTHAEFQECFIKIWAHFYSKKRADMEKRIQNYKDYSVV